MHYEPYKTRQILFIVDINVSSPLIKKGEPLSTKRFSAKDLFNSLMIDIRSIVCQRLVKISSIEVRKSSPPKEADTSTSSSCGQVLGIHNLGWMINFNFVGNEVTNLSFTESNRDITAGYRLMPGGRMKNTANNETLSEDKFKTNAKCKIAF